MNGGEISILGTGGVNSGNITPGIWINNAASLVSTSTGDINLVGTGTDTSGLYNQGVAFSSDAVVNSTSGNISVTGTTAGPDFAAIDFDDLNSGTITQLQTGGSIILNGNLGEINTITGITTAAVWAGTNIDANGILGPGQSPGQVIMNGNFNIGAGDKLEFEFTDYIIPGTDFDQVVVNGMVDITDATLSLVDIGLAGTLAEGSVITIIENDGADAVVGSFNGIPQATQFHLMVNSCLSTMMEVMVMM